VQRENFFENRVDVGRPKIKDLLQRRSKIGKEYQYSHPSISTPAFMRTSTPEYQYSHIHAYFSQHIPVVQSIPLLLCQEFISIHHGHHSHELVPKFSKHGPLKWFCEEIRDHFTHGAPFSTDFSSPDPIRDKEIANGDVLGILATRHFTIFLQ
jgi:hypothetical protein